MIYCVGLLEKFNLHDLWVSNQNNNFRVRLSSFQITDIKIIGFNISNKKGIPLIPTEGKIRYS